jgi:hypothetical protein
LLDLETEDQGERRLMRFPTWYIVPSAKWRNEGGFNVAIE